eukprot:241640-Prymnesium_polylepis.1
MRDGRETRGALVARSGRLGVGRKGGAGECVAGLGRFLGHGFNPQLNPWNIAYWGRVRRRTLI